MTKFDDIYEIASVNFGLVTSAQAREAGVTNNELVQYARRGRSNSDGSAREDPSNANGLHRAMRAGFEGASSPLSRRPVIAWCSYKEGWRQETPLRK